MLLQIRDYICREGIVSTQQLTREFSVDLPALQPMLDLWMKKGVIDKCQKQSGCQRRCFKCSTPEYYEYLAPKPS